MRVAILLLTLCALAAAAPARAQYGRDGRPPVSGVLPPPGEDDPEAIEEPEEGEPGRVCEKMCEADGSPCDPVSYKLEDGRCDEPGLGR